MQEVQISMQEIQISMQEVQGKSKKGLIFAEALLLLYADRFSNSPPSWLWLPWKRNSRCTPPIITLGRYFSFTIKTFIHFPHFVSCGPQLTPSRSKAVRRHFFSMSLFGSSNQSFNITAVAVFLWVIFTIVSCLRNAKVTETAAECYWKSMVRARLDRHEDHRSLSWFLQENRSPYDSISRIQESFARGIRNPGLWNRKFSSRNPESH